MMNTHALIICLLSVLAFSCCEDEELTFKRTEDQSEKLCLRIKNNNFVPWKKGQN
jgi:hypothetical protein